MMTKERLYLDTSVISVLFDPRDPFLQKQTQKFWPTLDRYEVFISKIVEDEIDMAPEPLRSQMLEKVAGKYSVPVEPEVEALARRYIEAGIFSEKSRNDALHVALATVAAADYLVSWNFRHLVKVKTRRMVNLVNLERGYRTVEIVSPSEL
jgi:predicted nucleic acid-binding protein